MIRATTFFAVLLSLAFTGEALAQDASSTATATCNFDPDKQLAVEYQHIAVNLKKPLFGHEVPYGKVWTPGQQPLTLFTTSPVEIGGKNLPVGAYTMFVLPNPKQWTLIISKNTDTSGKYDQQQDLLRVPMESGELPRPESQFSVYFAHVAPNQCSMRFAAGALGTSVIFEQR